MQQATRRKHPKDELHAQLLLQKPLQCQRVSAICETRHDTRAPLSAGLQSEASSPVRGPADLELSVVFGAWGCVTNDEHHLGSSVEHSKRRFKILGNNLNYSGSLAANLPHVNASFLLDIHPSTPGDSLQHAFNVWNVTAEVKTAYAQPSWHNLRITGPPQAPYYVTNTLLKREAKCQKSRFSHEQDTCISDSALVSALTAG
jgi:hypothetical protein